MSASFITWRPKSWNFTSEDKRLVCNISEYPATKDCPTEYHWYVGFFDGFSHNESGTAGSFEAAARSVGDLVIRRGWLK